MAAAVTGAVIVQLEEPMPVGAAGKVPPVTPSDDAVKLAVPPQVVFAGPTTVTPAGIASVKLKPVIAVALKLRSVMVSVLLPPAMIPAGEKTFVTDAAFCTRIVPLIFELFLAPCAEVTELAFNRLVALASNGEVLGRRATISAKMTQLPLAGIVPPLNMRFVPPPTADTVPPQPFDTLGTAANTSCVGKVSVKATLVSGKPLLLFN